MESKSRQSLNRTVTPEVRQKLDDMGLLFYDELSDEVKPIAFNCALFVEEQALSKQIDVSGIESVREADWNRYYPVPQLRQSEVLLSLWGEASAYICVLVRSHLARKSYRVLRKPYGG